MADGGYYDNLGISSLVEWLDAKSRSEQNVDEVLIIEIRGAPSPRSYAGDGTEGRPVKPSTEASDRRSKAGWLYQYTAPLGTVLAGRDTAQRANNETESDLLLDKCDEQDEENERVKQGEPKPRGVEITRALFEFDRHDPPLSWHLTPRDKESIEENWHEEPNERGNSCAGWEKVQAFLADGENSH